MLILYHQLHFNAFASPAVGSKWGMFARDTQLSPELLAGPSGTESAVPSVFASKVSDVRRSGPAGWDSVLLARLRFKIDAEDPTSR
jgi:abelson tyrosine-protein kinase 1